MVNQTKKERIKTPLIVQNAMIWQPLQQQR